MTEKPRILVVDASQSGADGLLERWRELCEIVRVESQAQLLPFLQTRQFNAIFWPVRDAAAVGQLESTLQARQVLEGLPSGVAVVRSDLKVVWANRAFGRCCGTDPVGKPYYEALGSPQILGPDYCPFHTALNGKVAITRLHCKGDRYLELQIAPLYGADQGIGQLITLARDVTQDVLHRQKLEALHMAGNELAGLSADQLAEMSMEERVELLKMNILRLTHDLLKYDIIEIRLLDPKTRKLESLIQEGMTPSASGRELYSQAEGNGITGYVAATGKSYLCPDTSIDPLYLEGSVGAHSSLTVPLMYQDEIIGTFNVESPKPNAFGEDELKFTEMFSREIAAALHTLQLLTVEKRTAASQSVEAISREVALPVDEILAAATSVLERYIGHDAEMAAKLKVILSSARAIKQSIQKVGEDLAVPAASCKPGESPPQSLKGLRLLVVDNDERVRRSAHGILGRLGCIVETARDGQEAMTMARLSAYDVILADIRLPDLTGYEVYRKLREAQPDAKVVLMTAYGYDPAHSIVKARQEGLQHVLFKPFRVDQLLDALNSCTKTASGKTQFAGSSPTST